MPARPRPFVELLEQLRLSHEAELEELRAVSRPPEREAADGRPPPSHLSLGRPPPMGSGDLLAPEREATKDDGADLAPLPRGLDAPQSVEQELDALVTGVLSTTPANGDLRRDVSRSRSASGILLLRHWEAPGPFDAKLQAPYAGPRSLNSDSDVLKQNESFQDGWDLRMDSDAWSSLNTSLPRPILMLYHRPSSAVRVFITMLSALFIFYDIVMMPMEAFQADRGPPVLIEIGIAWIIRVFWNLDIVGSFFEGYYEEGELIMQPKSIAKHYLRSWFVVDVALVVVDWTALVLSDGPSVGSARSLKLMRFLRSFRTLRLLRVLKVGAVFTALQDCIAKELVNIEYRIAKVMLMIVFLNHFIACIWYAVGKADWAGDRHWVEFAFPAEVPLCATLQYRYLTSLYWALSNLGFGSTAVEPVNSGERIFAIICLFYAVITVTHLLGSMTTLMDHLQNANHEQTEQSFLFRRYCNEQDISKDLRMRTQRFLEYSFKRHSEAVDPNAITCFTLLSEPLYAELLYESNKPFLESHAFFRVLVKDNYLDSRRSVHTGIVHKLAHQALKSVELARRDVLFCEGDMGRSTYLSDDGEMRYIRGKRTKTIRPGQWVSEASLWTHWTHAGELQAVTECQLMAMNSKIFGDIMYEHPGTWEIAREYAEEFALHLGNIPDERRTDLSLDPRHRGTFEMGDTEVVGSLFNWAMRGSTRLFAWGRKQMPEHHDIWDDITESTVPIYHSWVRKD